MKINFLELCNDDTPDILRDLPHLRCNLLAHFLIFDQIFKMNKLSLSKYFII